MFINEYDILIDKILDNIYDKEDILKFNKINLEKQLRNSSKYIKDTEKLSKDSNIVKELNEITQNIVFAYMICLCFLSDDKNINDIKTILIRSKILNSENLGNITSIFEDIKILICILKEDNQEKLLTLYNTNERYKVGIDLLNEFGYENTMLNLKGETKKHKHNLVKYVVIVRYYRKKFRKQIFDLIFTENNKKYFIEVVLPKLKILDYSNIESILSTDEVRQGMVNEILEFYEEYEKSVNINIENDIKKKIDKLLNSKIVIPITDEFLRFHKITEKYEKMSTHINKTERENVKDQTKIRYIITKLEKVKDLYSKKIKNNKELLNEVDKMFYKPLIHRKAIIYNEIEELSIINKLLLSGKKAIDSNEFYHDLLSLRKNAYINFRDFKSDGFKHEIKKTGISVRYSGIESLESKQIVSKNLKLDTRSISKTAKAHIVGLFILEDNKSIHDIKYKDIVDIRTINSNGFQATKDVLLDKFNLNNKKNYYWIFDIEKDTFNQDTFELTSNKNSEFARLLVSQIYDFCLNECFNKIMSKLNNFSSLDPFHSFNLSSYYQNKMLKFAKNSDFEKEVNKKIYDIIPINKDYYDDKENTIYGIIGDVKKLPIDNRIEKEIETVYIPYLENKEIIDLDEESSYCQHTLDWSALSQLRNKNPNKHSELLYNFIKKYVITNADNEYICKSCKQFVDIQNFLSNPFEGGSSGIDLIITSSKNLSEIKEYSKFSVLIKNMDKLVEKVAQINNFTYYLGNEQIHKIRRQDIIKQVIDTIILHDKTLRTKNMDKRNRELAAFRNYGVSSDYTYFFIFPLTNDIFKSSSKETDKFKKIKVNNIIAYILLFMIIDLNDSQVIMFEYNKICNYILFDKFKDILFNKLKIKVDTTKKTIPVTELNTFCYILYYTSCMLSKYNIWYMSNIEKMNSLSFKQKSIIHTLIDLINSLLETFSENENYMYEILGSKIINKIKTLFKNEEVLDAIKKKEEKKVLINNNKIQIIKSNIKSIVLKEEMTKYEAVLRDKNEKGLYFITKMKMPERDTDKIIGKEISSIYKNYDLDNKIKLAQIYDKTGIVRRFKISYNEASKLDKKYFEEMINNLSKNKNKVTKNFENIIYQNLEKDKKEFSKLEFKNNLSLLLKEFEKLDNNIIKVGGTTFNIYESKLNLSYDYLGNKLQKIFYIEIKNEKISIKFDKELNLDIYEIFDASNDIKLIFNKYTLHYLGYRQKSNKFTDLKNLNIYAQYIPSIKELIETLGCKMNYYNFENKKDVKNEIRNSISSLKEYIRKYKVYLNQLKYKNINDSHQIVKYYISKIDNLKLNDNNVKVFDNINLILKLQNTSIDKISKIKNISKYELIELSDSYSKLSNYFVGELLKLIEINNNKYVKNNLIYFILSVLNLFYFENFNQYNDFDLIRYTQIMKLDIDLLEEIRDEILYTEDEFINESTDEQRDEIAQLSIDNDEMDDALDIDSDDYDSEDGDGDVMFHDADN
jgi:hypothetical protein